MQKVHSAGITIPPSLTLGVKSNNNNQINNNNIYSLLIPPIQQQQQQDNIMNWGLPKLPNNNNSGHQDKKIKLSIRDEDKFKQDIDSSMDESEDDQTLPNFKQFELNIVDGGKSNSLQNLLSSKTILSSPSSTSSSPSHEPNFTSISSINSSGIGNSKDFRLGYSFESSHSPYSSYPSSPIDHHIQPSSSNLVTQQKSNQLSTERKQIQEWIQELQSIRKRESILLENLKNYTSDDSDEDSQCHSPAIVNSSSISTTPNPIPQSISTLYNLINNNTTTNTTTPTNNNSNEIVLIQQQPPENIIFNRYINPAPILLIDQDIIGKCSGYLIVNASLVHRPTSKSNINKVSIKGNQDLLQGVKSIIVEKSGVVLFNKLKVNDSGFKYQNQHFNLYFTLSEISSDNQIHTISQVISSPFQFSTRSNNNSSQKRKFEEIDSEQEPSSPHSKNSPVCSSPYSPPSPLISNFEQPQQQSISMNSSSSSSSSSLVLGTNNSTKELSDSNYIDITDLLVLPQKEAAARLGISESMLCKRFKECTKRKWPYRYLKKIDKVIKILSFQNINEMPKEEKEKLEKFTIEREECLRPVKIRITGCLEKDDLDFSNHSVSSPSSTSGSNNNTSANLVIGSVNSQQQPHLIASSSKSQIHNIINNTSLNSDDIPQAPRVNNAKMFDTFTNGGESNGLENILETLEMLKHTH